MVAGMLGDLFGSRVYVALEKHPYGRMRVEDADDQRWALSSTTGALLKLHCKLAHDNSVSTWEHHSLAVELF